MDRKLGLFSRTTIVIYAIVGLAVIAVVVWRITDDNAGDFVADFMTDKRGCTDVTRETVTVATLRQPRAKRLGENANELTELSCMPDGPTMTLIRFSSPDAAQAALDAASGRISTFCSWDDVVLVPGPYSTNDTIDACAHRPSSVE